MMTTRPPSRHLPMPADDSMRLTHCMSLGCRTPPFLHPGHRPARRRVNQDSQGAYIPWDANECRPSVRAAAGQNISTAVQVFPYFRARSIRILRLTRGSITDIVVERRRTANRSGASASADCYTVRWIVGDIYRKRQRATSQSPSHHHGGIAQKSERRYRESTLGRQQSDRRTYLIEAALPGPESHTCVSAWF